MAYLFGRGRRAAASTAAYTAPDEGVMRTFSYAKGSAVRTNIRDRQNLNLGSPTRGPVGVSDSVGSPAILRDKNGALRTRGTTNRLGAQEYLEGRGRPNLFQRMRAGRQLDPMQGPVDRSRSFAHLRQKRNSKTLAGVQDASFRRMESMSLEEAFGPSGATSSSVVSSGGGRTTSSSVVSSGGRRRGFNLGMEGFGATKGVSQKYGPLGGSFLYLEGTRPEPGTRLRPPRGPKGGTLRPPRAAVNSAPPSVPPRAAVNASPPPAPTVGTAGRSAADNVAARVTEEVGQTITRTAGRKGMFTAGMDYLKTSKGKRNALIAAGVVTAGAVVSKRRQGGTSSGRQGMYRY